MILLHDPPQLTAETVAVQRNKKKGKRVSFDRDERGNVKTDILGPLLKPSSEMSDLEKQSLYWRKWDYDVFRSARHMLVSVTRQSFAREPPRTCRNNTDSYQKIITRLSDACHETETLARRQDLYRLASEGTRTNSLRGLEHHLVPEVTTQRQAEKKRFHAKFMEIQELLSGGDPDLKVDGLCRVSRMYSESDKLYAQAFGTVDEIAARWEFMDEPSNAAVFCGCRDIAHGQHPLSPFATRTSSSIMIV